MSSPECRDPAVKLFHNEGTLDRFLNDEPVLSIRDKDRLSKKENILINTSSTKFPNPRLESNRRRLTLKESVLFEEPPLELEEKDRFDTTFLIAIASNYRTRSEKYFRPISAIKSSYFEAKYKTIRVSMRDSSALYAYQKILSC